MCEECKNWARTFDNEVLFSEHHPSCSKKNIETESKKHILNLLEALEYEANMGDGISEEFFDVYKSAKFFAKGIV